MRSCHAAPPLVLAALVLLCPAARAETVASLDDTNITVAANAAGSVAQDLVPVGTQFQVNTYTLHYQYDSVATRDGNGGFVVVWMSEYSPVTSEPVADIKGQRYTASGLPDGGEFQINTVHSNKYGLYHLKPEASSIAGVGFVVVWESHGIGESGSNSEDFSVRGRRYTSDGIPVDADFQVNTYTTSDQRRPGVVSDGAGGFVVVWESQGSAGTDSAGWSIQGQRYAADGSPVGGEFQVNTYTMGDQKSPGVSPDGSGGFVVVWASDEPSEWRVRGQRFAADGSSSGSEFQVNVSTAGFHTQPVVSPDSSGGFVVVWASHGSGGSDSSSISIQGQRYEADGRAIDGEFQINTYTTGQQVKPSVISSSGGGFIVVWASDGSHGTDTHGDSVQGQFYGSDGLPTGGEFQINTYTTDWQGLPTATLDAAGDLVVTWSSWGSAGTDMSFTSVQAQRYTLLQTIFADGFETGDTEIWSLTVP